MDHSIREDRGALVVSLAGDVDLESSPRARTVLLDCVGRNRTVLVDMSAIAYIDSSGVASLVEAFQSARKAGIRFALVAVSDAAMRVLQLARLDRIFSIHASLDDALADGV
jgi:anti-sigma B factor antagonist